MNNALMNYPTLRRNKINGWIKKKFGKIYINEPPDLGQDIRIFVSHEDGQQNLSKQRGLIIRQDGQDYSFGGIGQPSSPDNREMGSWLQGWNQCQVSTTWPLPC